MELLVASTMIAVLFMGLGAHLRGGITVWQRATGTGERIQRQRVALDRIARDLAHGLLYDTRRESYGEGIGMLPTPVFERSKLAWVTVEAAAPPELPAARFVTYQCETRDGVPGLWRMSQPLGTARARQAADPALLLPGCAMLTARYAAQPEQPEAPLQWRDEWTDAVQRLPALIELSLTMASGEDIRRIMAIPTGTLKPPQAE